MRGSRPRGCAPLRAAGLGGLPRAGASAGSRPRAAVVLGRRGALLRAHRAGAVRPFNSAGTLQTLTLCLVFAGLASRIRPNVRSHRDAVVRARAVLRRGHVHHHHPHHGGGMEPVAAALTAILAAGTSRPPSVRSRYAPAASPSPWSHWPSPRPGRSRSAATRAADRRQRRAPARTRTCTRGPARRRQHRQPLLARLGYLVVVMAPGRPRARLTRRRVLTAIRDNEPRTRVLGVDTWRTSSRSSPSRRSSRPPAASSTRWPSAARRHTPRPAT